MSVTRTLAEAWLNRASRAAAILEHALAVPSLFKPDHIEQQRREYAHAMQQDDRRAAGL